MSKTFIISDLHFNHHRCIGLDDRPFKSTEEMNQVMINNWNSVVSKKDTVYMLGDFSFRDRDNNIEEQILSLNGDIKLLIGNHESDLLSAIKNNTLVQNKVENLGFMTEQKIKPDIHYPHKLPKYVLSHYPIPAYNGHFRSNCYHFYGHVHTTMEEINAQYARLINMYQRPDPNIHKMLNVGAMTPWVNYTPISFEDAMKMADMQSEWMYDLVSIREIIPSIEDFKMLYVDKFKMNYREASKNHGF